MGWLFVFHGISTFEGIYCQILFKKKKRIVCNIIFERVRVLLFALVNDLNCFYEILIIQSRISN